MKISIVTISFNQADFLPDCIESVLNQDYEDIEYIVVDAGSTDGSREIIMRYSPRIAQVIFEPDEGPADGLNKGFRRAMGDVFGYLNSDDILLPGAVRHVVEKFTHAPDKDVLCGNGFQIDESGSVVRKIFSTNWSLRAYVYGACNIVQQATFFRREVFHRAGGFNIKNYTCWDAELLVDMALARAKVYRIAESLAGFRIHSSSITGSGRQQGKEYFNEIIRISEKALGRPQIRIDVALSFLYLFAKRIRHPFASIHGGMWRIKRMFRI
jgi:glycosyltransferase involved in cell wall biosynthesis